MRRRRALADRSGPAGQLAVYAQRYAVAGDAERLSDVRSWIDMLEAAGNDPAIGDLFLAFAKADRP